MLFSGKCLKLITPLYWRRYDGTPQHISLKVRFLGVPLTPFFSPKKILYRKVSSEASRLHASSFGLEAGKSFVDFLVATAFTKAVLIDGFVEIRCRAMVPGGNSAEFVLDLFFGWWVETWPELKVVFWPPTREWKGHELNHVVGKFFFGKL